MGVGYRNDNAALTVMDCGLFLPIATLVAALWALVDVAWGQRRARRTGTTDTPPPDPGRG